MSVKRPDPHDIAIGGRIRGLRMQRGMSQTALADSIGVTFQQVQKYEKGANRVTGGRLIRIADLLNVTIDEFLGGTSAQVKHVLGGGTPDPLHLLSQTREGVRLAKAFNSLEHKPSRAALVQVAEAFASGERKKSAR